MTGLEEGERPNGNSSCALPRVAKALKFCMGTNTDPLFLLAKSGSFFGNVLIPFNGAFVDRKSSEKLEK